MADRRTPELLPLVVGLLAMAVAVLVLLAHGHAVHLDAVVVIGTVWVLLGLVGLTRVASHLRGVRD